MLSSVEPSVPRIGWMTLKHRIALALALFAAFALGMMSLNPIARAMEMLTTKACSSLVSCVGGANASTGPGLYGTSAGGNGIVGSTSASSTAPSMSRGGVLGQDISKNGIYGFGVRGNSKNGIGVVGVSQNSIGVQAVLDGNASNAAALEGIDASKTGGNDAIYASTLQGTALYLVSKSDGTQGFSAGIQMFAENGVDMIYMRGSDNSFISADAHADLFTSGLIYTSGSCQNGCSPVRHVTSTAAMTASPTLEDEGEAQLRAGSAFVRLEPRFANAIERRLGYIVLITPEGDTRGLYVAQRSPNGFMVREIAGGRSSLPFAYRIVAHPFGRTTDRLPFVNERVASPHEAPGTTR